ncbi:manganese catalase family protein [Caldovatus aquaticus]|uniref:Manganese catalase family protein n=1 Tax=Caldovatus aquaticus TaxID=2865671 RepID=A0ABS7F1K2_9PROT|nr:manganese catalase family protein [Caldovatus aquaticus]MBW8268852.1 manganese catalase family protein [Caldovatus aquaticus]
MFLRIDRLQVEMPMPTRPDPSAAAAVQELMGGRFGEMTTLNTYMYQSFNFRQRDKLRPFYALIANIATEELGHIELVGATVNALLHGIEPKGDTAKGEAPFADPFKTAAGAGPSFHINGPHGIMAANALGQPWRGDYIFNSGNLILDLLHNFFLENGARTVKLRVYQMTDNPAARRMLGYLFTRGGVHAEAYARALEQLTGVDMKKMLPIPNIRAEEIPESRKFLEEGSHRRLYRFSTTDFDEIRAIWQGQALDGSGPLEVTDGPPTGGPQYQLEGVAQAFIPDYHPEEILEIARKLYQKASG